MIGDRFKSKRLQKSNVKPTLQKVSCIQQSYRQNRFKYSQKMFTESKKQCYSRKGSSDNQNNSACW